MYEKFKSIITNDALYIIMVLITVALISFSLGRQSVIEKPANSAQTGIVFKAAQEITELTDNNQDPLLVASQSGTRYHLLNCPGAKQINQENKIYFTSLDEARSAGYLPAANCPELDQI